MDSQDQISWVKNEFEYGEGIEDDKIYFCGNSLGLQHKSVKDKIKLIGKEIIIPIVLWDERLSTVGSFNLSSQLDINISKRVKNIDQNSATFILQGVLDFLSK